MWHGEDVSAAPEEGGSGVRAALLGMAAAGLHLGFDLASTAIGAAPPYLRLADAPEVFRSLSPVSVSIATSAVSGVIAVIVLSIFSTARHRRALRLGIAVTAFWVFSATLSRLAWFSTPLLPTAVSIALGIPRGLAIGWVLARFSNVR